ncbi:MAG: DUF481 domain-containing protein [Opitutaceae bacterium]|nr:DUF481 domain-containing protein [Opitutaceae bacterium]
MLSFLVLLAVLFFAAGSTPAQANDASAARPGPTNWPDVLVFDDGDRLTGRLLGRENETIIFLSARAGELRVAAGTAHVEPAAAIPDLPSHHGFNAEESLPSMPASLTARMTAADSLTAGMAETKPEIPDSWLGSLGGVFRDWDGRIATAMSMTHDTSNGENYGADLKLARTWSKNSATIEVHYYYAEVDDDVQTDLLKASGTLRHDFSAPFFVSYRPSLEWNRNHEIDGAEADYALAQHSIEFGVNLLETKSTKASFGLAENVFDLWTIDTGDHATRDAQSLFGEVSLDLPWRITIATRATWYYSLASGDRGREEQFELTKKFSDTLSLGLHHESRRDNPDERIADYSLLRFQVGLDF